MNARKIRIIYLLLTVFLLEIMAPIHTCAAAEWNAPFSVRVQYWNSWNKGGASIYVNDAVVDVWNQEDYQAELPVYNGTIYMPIRTAELWLGATVEWDQENGLLTIDLGKTLPLYIKVGTAPFEKRWTRDLLAQRDLERKQGVEVELRPDITVEVDGLEWIMTNAAGETVYPLTLRGELHLPIRNVAQLCGKTILWLPDPIWGSEHLYLYDPPTQGQLDYAAEYSLKTQQYADQLIKGFEDLDTREDLTEETFFEAVRALKAITDEAISLPYPSADTPRYEAVSVQMRWQETIENIDFCLRAPGEYPKLKPESWQSKRESVVSSGFFRYAQLQESIDHMKLVIDAVIANQA